MVKKLLLSLCLILKINPLINCMENKELYQKSVPNIDKHFIDINQTLQSVGLLPDLCRIIGEYDGFRQIHQFDETKGGHDSHVPRDEFDEDDCTVFANEIKTMTYIPNIKCLASVCSGETIKLWDFDTNKKTYLSCIASLYKNCREYPKTVYALEYIPDIKCLASAHNDGCYSSIIKLWDLDNKSEMYTKCIATFNLFHSVYALEYIPDLKCLASGSDSTIKLWDLDKDSKTYKTCITALDNENNGHTSIVNILMYISDIKILVSGSWDKTIKLWNLDINNSDKYKKCIATININTSDDFEYIFSLIYIPNNKCLASSSLNRLSRNSIIQLWDLDDNNKDTYLKCIVTFDKSKDENISIASSLTDVSDILRFVSNSLNILDVDISNSMYKNCIGAFNSYGRNKCYISDINCLASSEKNAIINIQINMKDVLGNPRFLKSNDTLEDQIQANKIEQTKSDNSWCVIS